VDEIGSSDDYLMSSVNKDNAQVYAVVYKGKESFMQRLQGAFGGILASLGISSYNGL
jgi:hypothetical protein